MIYIGTTGWSFDFWEGSFYPDEYDGDKLAYFSEIAAFTELRSTFHRIPNESKISEWDTNTPDNFIFVGRMLKEVTQNLEKINENLVNEYFDAMNLLDKKFSMLLLHFPTKFQMGTKTYENLVHLLDIVNNKFTGHILVEAPNRSWQKEEIQLLLQEKSACLVGNDRRPIPSLMRDKELYYHRLLGDKITVPQSKFGEKPLNRDNDIKFWAEHMKFASKNIEAVFVAVDNHFSGNSTHDAFLMADWLRKLDVEFSGFQKVTTQTV